MELQITFRKRSVRTQILEVGLLYPLDRDPGQNSGDITRSEKYFVSATNFRLLQ